MHGYDRQRIRVGQAIPGRHSWSFSARCAILVTCCIFRCCGRFLCVSLLYAFIKPLGHIDPPVQVVPPWKQRSTGVQNIAAAPNDLFHVLAEERVWGFKLQNHFTPC